MHTLFLVLIVALASAISAAAVSAKPDLAHEQAFKNVDAFMDRLTRYIVEHPNHAKRDYYSDEHAKEMNALEVELTERTTEHPAGKRDLAYNVDLDEINEWKPSMPNGPPSLPSEKARRECSTSASVPQSPSRIAQASLSLISTESGLISLRPANRSSIGLNASSASTATSL